MSIFYKMLIMSRILTTPFLRNLPSGGGRWMFFMIFSASFKIFHRYFWVLRCLAGPSAFSSMRLGPRDRRAVANDCEDNAGTRPMMSRATACRTRSSPAVLPLENPRQKGRDIGCWRTHILKKRKIANLALHFQ